MTEDEKTLAAQAEEAAKTKKVPDNGLAQGVPPTPLTNAAFTPHPPGYKQQAGADKELFNAAYQENQNNKNSETNDVSPLSPARMFPSVAKAQTDYETNFTNASGLGEKAGTVIRGSGDLVAGVINDVAWQPLGKAINAVTDTATGAFRGFMGDVGKDQATASNQTPPVKPATPDKGATPNNQATTGTPAQPPTEEVRNQDFNIVEYKGSHGERAFSNIRPEDRDKGGNLTVMDTSEGYKANLATLRNGFEQAAAQGDVERMRNTAITPADFARLGAATKQQEQSIQRGNALAILNADMSAQTKNIENKLRMPDVGRSERAKLLDQLDKTNNARNALLIPQQVAVANPLAVLDNANNSNDKYEARDLASRQRDLFRKASLMENEKERNAALAQGLALTGKTLQETKAQSEKWKDVSVTNADGSTSLWVLNENTGEVRKTPSPINPNAAAVKDAVDKTFKKGGDSNDAVMILMEGGMTQEEAVKAVGNYSQK